MSLTNKLTETFAAVGAGVKSLTDVLAALTGRVETLETTPPTDMTDEAVKAAYERNGDTNAYTNAAKGKVDLVSVTGAVNLDDLGDLSHDFLADYTTARDA